jgi:hypothetical protein
VSDHNVARNREAEAAAAIITSPSLIASGESIEDTLPIRSGNPRPIVSDR